MQSFKHCFQTKLMNFFSFSISFCTFASSIGAIDDLIGPLYGLTMKEVDFIKNYEIEFRLSNDE